MADFFKDLVDSALGPRPFLELLTQIGTFAGAVSGIRMASIKHFDWFGAYVIGFVTTLGGGTLRDVLMNRPPFWMEDYSYLLTTFFALVAVLLFGRRFITEKITWFVFDTIAISIFMLIGMEKVIALENLKALALGLEFTDSLKFACWWKAIIMGVITAVFGGVLRDICINEVPLIFRKEIYAMACALGGVIYFVLMAFGVDPRICGIVCVFSIFVIRALAIKFNLGVPILVGRGTIHLPIPHHHKKVAGHDSEAHHRQKA